MTFAEFWGSLGYILALYIAVMMVAWKISRRSKFYLRVVLCFAVICAYKYTFDYVLPFLKTQEHFTLIIRTSDSFVLYILSAASVAFCFQCNFWATLFCSTAGYCMQHMSQRTYLVFAHLTGLSNVYLGAAVLIAITAVFYAAIYYFFIRKSEYTGTTLDNKVQISVSFFTVLITIFLNSFAMRAVGDGGVIYVMLFSILTAILIVYIEFGWLAARKEEIKKDTIRRMLHNSREQYALEKELVEVVNMKVHDLKHRFSQESLKNSLADMNEAVQLYDSFYTTGNDSLDVVLTNKGLLCEKYGIQFTCLVDGKKLDFLTEEEIFSLFGNILDNAIEAVKKLDEPEKRVVSLTSRIDGMGRFVIHEENYCSGRLEFVDGYPRTTKDSEYYHGFGVKSIGFIVKKHGGECKINASGDIFEIDCIFPLPE